MRRGGAPRVAQWEKEGGSPLSWSCSALWEREGDCVEEEEEGEGAIGGMGEEMRRGGRDIMWGRGSAAGRGSGLRKRE
jgi:hypothetical protein